jgi:hypothetical protein
MAPLHSDDSLPEPGSLVGCWVVGQRIDSSRGETVLSVVHKARPRARGYVMKLAPKGGDERFEREAWILSRVPRPSAPQLEDRGTWTSPQGEDYPYFVIRLAEGLGFHAWALEQEGMLGRLARVTRALPATHPHWAHRISFESTPGVTVPRPRQPKRREWRPRLALAGGCLAAALLSLLLPRDKNPKDISSSKPGSSPYSCGQPDDETALGEEALASASPAETPRGSEKKVSREIPDTPRPGQKRPPCDQQSAKVVKGGCWLPVEGARPPCDTGLYEHDGRCYLPAPNPDERVPTSGEER